MFGLPEGPISQDMRIQRETHDTNMKAVGLRQQLEMFKEAGGFQTDAGRALGQQIIQNNPSLSKLMAPKMNDPNSFKSTEQIAANDFVAKDRAQQQTEWTQNNETYETGKAEHAKDRQRLEGTIWPREDQEHTLGLAERAVEGEQKRKDRNYQNTEMDARSAALEKLRKDNPDAATAIDLGFVPDSLKKDKTSSEQSKEKRENLKILKELSEQNTDTATGKVKDEELQAKLDVAIKAGTDDLLGITGQSTPKQAQSRFADFFTGMGQGQKRSWFDDTASKEDVVARANNFINDMVARGYDRNEAMTKAVTEYNAVLNQDRKAWFRQYPDVDLAAELAPQMARQEAIQTNKPVVNTGDGVDTTPKQMPADLNADEQAEFASIEKAMPGFDVRSDYAKDPGFYKKLFQAIKDGVPDGKGGKRKLSQKEITSLIQG
jgi:hypothetical protein